MSFIYNGQMFGEEKNLKNLKDTNPTLLPPLTGEGGERLSYTKANKLITALYMVTDIMDKDEPLKNKLRILGVEILSDITTMTRLNLVRNIQGILSFLDIAFTMNMISEMNKNILVNEFARFKNSLVAPQDNPAWLEDFLREEKEGKGVLFRHNSIGHKGHLPARAGTRIGVQKGSTLMKALSDRIDSRASHDTLDLASYSPDFDILKKERRNEIINLIQKMGGNATITDIKNGAYGSLTSCSEKTLQRELASMVKDNVLNKTGEKRWSRYFIK